MDRGIVLSCCRRREKATRKTPAAAIWKNPAAAAAGSTRKRTLEAQLKSRRRTHGGWKNPLKMFHGLKERIGVRAGWSGPFATKAGAQRVQMATQPPAHPIHRFQGKWQAQLFDRGFD